MGPVATREIFWNIGPDARTAFYLLAALAVGVCFYGFYRRVRLWRRGKPAEHLAHFGERLRFAVRQVFRHESLLRRRLPGVFHLLIFWSFAALFIGTVIIAIEYDTPLDFFHGSFFLVYELVLDVAGIVFLVGLGIAALRRYRLRPRHLEKPAVDSRWDGFYLLAMLFVVVSTGYLVEAARLAATMPPWRGWSPVAASLAWLLSRFGMTEESARALHFASWWLHALLVFGFIASIPFSGFGHIVFSPLRILLRSLRPKGAWSTPFRVEALETLPAEAHVGATTARDFSWTERLSFDACTRCGRCDDECPALAAGTALSPKSLILKLRARMSDREADGGNLFDSGSPSSISRDEVWACTTCRACMESCPVSIAHIDVIADIRRGLVDAFDLPQSIQKTLGNIDRECNPWGFPHAERASWISRLPASLQVKQIGDVPDPEVVYWVGCAASYDERANLVARAFLRLLDAAEVRYAVLGAEEKCTAEVARRLGEEGLFQRFACGNLETLRRHRVRRVVTTCPHCFNTLRNEYPGLGGDFLEVTDHSSFLSELIASGRLPIARGSELAVTYHDPCYLGRHNGVYEPPRTVLESVAGLRLVEMERHRERSFCCGAGGANYWFDVPRKEKCEAIRLEEARRTGTDVLAVACPFCLSMFSEAQKKTKQDGETAVLDVAEILAERLGGG